MSFVLLTKFFFQFDEKRYREIKISLNVYTICSNWQSALKILPGQGLTTKDTNNCFGFWYCYCFCFCFCTLGGQKFRLREKEMILILITTRAVLVQHWFTFQCRCLPIHLSVAMFIDRFRDSDCKSRKIVGEIRLTHSSVFLFLTYTVMILQIYEYASII